ncbi:MAG: glucose-1-phosphate adenylyltransferase, partial [Candidatus Latescibacteria bacterium]|nr:glucose-1-phosphate adenylyltransferase [Candidatus Latescibacterota bacterium]
VYWRDIGLLDAYWEANMDLVSETPEFDLHDPQWPIRTHTSPYPPSRLHIQPQTDSHLVVAQGCVIDNARVERCVLSPGVHIAPNATVTDSVLMEGVEVGANAHLHRVIADEGVIIPANNQIGIDHDADRQRFTVTDGGIVAIPKGLPIE